jgi:hypothetical protein
MHLTPTKETIMSGAQHFSKRGKTGLHVAAPFMFFLVSAPVCSADESATATPATAGSATAGDTQAAITSGHVARAIFTTGIADREPVDQLETVSTNVERLFFFSDLRGLAGQIVTHRWEYAGQVMAEVTFKVGNGARWRVYSSKNLLPEWTGAWTVVVSNESGQVLQTSIFEYSAE